MYQDDLAKLSRDELIALGLAVTVIGHSGLMR
jgi:hypothetical protein